MSIIEKLFNEIQVMKTQITHKEDILAEDLWIINLLMAAYIDENFINNISYKDIDCTVNEVLNIFENRDKDVILLKFKYNNTTSEIVEKMKLSSERLVQQILAASLRKLRRPNIQAIFIYGFKNYNKLAEICKSKSVITFAIFNENYIESFLKEGKSFSIEYMPFSTRPYNLLLLNGIDSIDKLLNISREELSSIKLMDEKSVEEIINILNIYGFKY